MKISQKVALIVTLLILFYTSIVFVVLTFYIAPQFLDIEKNDTRLNLERTLSMIEREIRSLENYAVDYARWDDTYRFIQRRDQDYLESNFNPTSMSQQNIDFVLLHRPDGTTAFEQAYDYSKVPPVSLPADAIIGSLIAMTTIPVSEPLRSGIISTPSGLMLIASCPITDSNNTQKPRGRLIAGRFFNAAEQERLREQHRFDFLIHPLSGENCLSEDLVARIQKKPLGVFIRRENTYTGYRLLHDINGAPIAAVSLKHRIQFANAGILVVRSAIALLVTGSLVLLAVILFLLRRKIIRPIEALTGAASAITAREDFFERLPDTRHDEIGSLASAFNLLLDKLLVINASLEIRVEQRTRALEESNHELLLLGRVFDNSLDGIIITDTAGSIVKVNDAFTKITGYSAEEVIGKDPSLLKSNRHDDTYFNEMVRLVQETGKWSGEIWARHKRGRVFPEWISLSAIADASGTVTHYMGIFHDISDAKQQESYIKYQAFHDTLTGLPNRTLLFERMHKAIARNRTSGFKMALLFLDLDHFKNINDSLGHEYGDILLQHVAERLEKLLRVSDTVARLGGDEFIVMIEDVADDDQPGHLAERIISCFKDPYVIKDQIFHVGTSIGIALFPDDGDEVGVLLRNADTAMYMAKEEGRLRYRHFTSSLNERVAKRLNLETELRMAITMDQFEVHYQPKYNCVKGRIDGVEGLARWRKDGKLVSPLGFIPLAEETGLIIPLDRIILEKACREMAELNTGREVPVKLALNSSAKALLKKKFPDELKTVLDKTGMKPEWFELEITETEMMKDLDATLDVIKRTAALGISIALDDFGTGYSSLSQLSRIPVNTLKIDRSFVIKIEDPDTRVAMVDTINKMAKDLKLKVVAEGVETGAQLTYLENIGCDMIQGYLISKPLPYADLLTFLGSFRLKNLQ